MSFLLDTSRKMSALKSLFLYTTEWDEMREKLARICEICDELEGDITDDRRKELNFRLNYETGTLSETDRSRYLMDYIVGCLETENDDGDPDFQGIYNEMTRWYRITGNYEFGTMYENEFMRMCRIIFTPFKIRLFCSATEAVKALEDSRWSMYFLYEKFFSQFEGGTFSEAEKTMIFNIGDDPVRQLEKLFSPINLVPIHVGYTISQRDFPV